MSTWSTVLDPNPALQWSNSIEDNFFHAAQWLDVCGRNGITLNPEKFVFCEDEVEFAGLRMVFFSEKIRFIFDYFVLVSAGAAVKTKAPGDSQGSPNLTTTTTTT